jgi:hypothetical protein
MNTMEKHLPSEAGSYSDGQEILRISCNSEFH